MISDNTHRKDIERQLLQAQKLESIGTLASGIAHDFNNILNNIYGFCSQLKKYHTNPVKVLKYAETISQSAERGAQISTKLLSFARQKNSDIGLLNIAAVIDEVVDMCNSTFMQSTEIQVIKNEMIWDVYGDKSSLYQLLLNLCLNARDAINEDPAKKNHGLITITVKNHIVNNDSIRWFGNKRPDNAVMISVQDNGSGITENIREKIFDPFFTTKTTSVQRGTGLGLSIVHNTVKHHHGAITVESTPGSGTAFTIYIPAVEMASQSDAYSAQEISMAKNNELIYLVDDEASMRQLGTELLEEAGFRVITAVNGREAVNVYRERFQEIDLVILDLVMPELDGGQAYVEMKRISPAVKAFFCSGFVTDQLITSLLEEEHLRALQKPFKPEIFVQTVCDVLYEKR
jgi:nitrogen-specific signal transduction histidine kinase